MKTKHMYFNTEEEVREYGKKNAIKYIEDGIRRANDNRAIYAPFAEIEGCELGYFMINDQWNSLYLCLHWRGIAMYLRQKDEKTHELGLCEDIDWMGIKKVYRDYSKYDDAPQKIGKPTAKKLDLWYDFLLIMRKRDEEARDLAIATMLAKIDVVCKNFPEAKEVKWSKGYWTFEKECNGITYTVQICINGEIYEDFRLSYSLMDYAVFPAEKAARMMRNGLQCVKKYDDHTKSWKYIEDAWDEYVKGFIGGRLDFNEENEE